MEIYKFSFDDENDALSNLSKYYGVSTEKIKSKLKEINTLLKNEALEWDIGKYARNIRLLLDAEPEPQIMKIKVSYYHRCGSDGTLDWFKEGLLHSPEGIKIFLNKSIKIVPELSDYKSEILRRSIIHLNSENKGKATGPFAFTTLREAKVRNAFDLPELFFGITGQYSLVVELEPIQEKLKMQLKPTIVKFYREYNSENIDWIILKYWKLICQKFDESFTSDSLNVGKGKTIPCEHIEKIFLYKKSTNDFVELI